MARQRLTNLDIADREMLFVMDNLAGDLHAEVDDLGDFLNLDVKNPRRHISARLAAMSRMGFVQRHPKRSAYRITRAGRMLISGELSPATADALRKMKQSDRVEAMRLIAQGTRRASNPARTMVRRQWMHTMGLKR